ncbi:MAG: HEPN domain-containing protein [Atribacterota bacterium]|nr:HEPN domain-containing protein [Atribacterota bacterium]
MRKGPRDEGQRWLEQAKEDLKWARELLAKGGYYLVCFLSQQVGEKALKAYLYAQGEEIVLGHSIGRLCEAAGMFNPLFLEKGKRWIILDSYYIPTRYPNGLLENIPARVYTEEAAQSAVTLAQEVVEVVESMIL